MKQYIVLSGDPTTDHAPKNITQATALAQKLEMQGYNAKIVPALCEQGVMQ